MNARAWSTDDVTLSTKCWEGDYRTVLSADGIQRLFGPFGPAARRQVVVNRVADRGHAQQLADGLVERGSVDVVVFAEDRWDAVAAALGIPGTWFGAAWPYSAPELVELDLAATPVVAHVAGDVALEPGEPWLPRALLGLDDPATAVVSAASPSGREQHEGKALHDGWVLSQEFSDQCFVGRREELLSAVVIRAEHWSSGKYPKPGGALTFEARVGSWLRATGRYRATDVHRSYVHPVFGREGDSYDAPMETLLPPLVAAGASYPTPGSVDATGLIIVRNGERTIASAVASLQWCRRVVVVDQQSEDRTVERASAAGADVRFSPITGTADPARRGAVESLEPGWVVMLDADELIPGPLARRIAQAIAEPSGHGAVRLARKNMILGKWARGAGWWPDPQLRVFRTQEVRFPGGVHGAIDVAEGASCLDLVDEALESPELALLHLNYTGYHDWFERANRYTTMQAAYSVVERSRPGVAFGRAFLRRYGRQGGWRLGRYGFDLSVLGASYDWLLVQKAAELQRGGPVQCAAEYDQLAMDVLLASQPPDRSQT